MARNNAPLRGLYGLDANNNRVINVERPDDTPTSTLQDAVNLEYFIEKNTTQEYDPNRLDYQEGFIVTYQDVLYVSKWHIHDVATGLGIAPGDVINQPVDETDSNPWSIIRTDRSWIGVSQDTTYYTELSKFYGVLTLDFNNILRLPDSTARYMTPGQRVTIADGSRNARNKPIQVLPDGLASINGDSEFWINTNGDNVSFVWDGVNWTTERREESIYRSISSPDTAIDNPLELSSNENVNISVTGDTYLELPPYPKIGDLIEINTLTNELLLDDDIIVSVSPGTTHLINVGQLTLKPGNVSTFKFSSKSLTTFKYDDTNIWTIYSQDNTNTEIVSATTVLLKGYESVIINTENITEDITLTIPNDLTHGNFINFSNMYFNENCDITLTCSPNGERSNLFKGDIQNMIFKRYSDVSVTGAPSSVTIDGSLAANLRLRYVVETSGDAFFYVENLNLRVDLVDYLYNERPGIIQLASDEQAVQQDYAPDGKTRADIPVTDHFGNTTNVRYDDHAITPHTLDNRRATDELAGLARVATSAEVNIDTVTNSGIDSTIIDSGTSGQWSPTGNGALEAQFQYDGSGGTHRDDIFLSPLKLTQRRATDTMSGILETATLTQALAQRDKVIDSSDVMDNVGTPLHDKIVTPDTLDNRRASETQTGLARLATFAELLTGVDSGAGSELIINPHKFEEWANRTINLETNDVSGLYNAGLGYTDLLNNVTPPINGRSTIWDGLLLDVAVATESQRGTLETATQTEANLQANDASAVDANNVGTPSDIHIITPLKLDARRATETQTGLSRLATEAEIDDGTLDNEVVINPYTFKYWLNKDEHIVTDAANGAIASDGLIVTNNIWEGVDLAITPATETQRGTLRVATQTEANANVGGSDSLYITPEKLNARRATTTLAGIAEIASESETDTATDNTTIISPLMLNRYFTVSEKAKATTEQRGTLEIATNAETWAGTGFTQPTQNDAETGTHNENIYTPGYAAYQTDRIVTPSSLNNALSNYLPRHATADDSWQLGGLTASFYTDSISQIQTRLDGAVINGGTAVSIEYTDFVKIGDMTISSADGVASFTFD